MRNILSLIMIAILLYLFTFYMDGEMGVILTAFLLMAAAVSFGFSLYGRKRIRLSLDCDGYVKKGGELEVRITVEKDGSFPLGVVDIVCGASPVFSVNKTVYRLSMLTGERTEFTYKLTAEIGGNGEVFVESVYSGGFLGFFRFKASQECPVSKNVGVIPDIPEISASSRLIRSIADTVITSDDDEANDTAMLFSANTSPGYEHREYVPGDSIRKVNWKLSARTPELMVRLDEAVSAVQPCIILDLFRNSADDVKDCLIREERLLQAAFGLMTMLVKQGIACKFIYRDSGGGITSDTADNPDMPAQILLRVLAVRVETDVRIDPGTSAAEACACIIAETDLGGSFSEVEDKITDKENSCVIIPDNSRPAPRLVMPVWYLTEENDFRRV